MGTIARVPEVERDQRVVGDYVYRVACARYNVNIPMPRLAYVLNEMEERESGLDLWLTYVSMIPSVTVSGNQWTAMRRIHWRSVKLG